MSQYSGDNQTHKATVSVAEGTRQVAVAAAATQAAAIAAELVFFRACLASAKPTVFQPTSTNKPSDL
jgi:hypothetical protein